VATETGNIEEIITITRDISERKKAEEEIKRLNEDLKHRTIELEAAYKELETYSYSVSHDLRSPLLGMNGLSRILLERYSNHLDILFYTSKKSKWR
jgi:light-regulated signal transduction histidine kinase (bacteriophytochrome)